jgi:hypothetical protein
MYYVPCDFRSTTCPSLRPLVSKLQVTAALSYVLVGKDRSHYPTLFICLYHHHSILEDTLVTYTPTVCGTSSGTCTSTSGPCPSSRRLWLWSEGVGARMPFRIFAKCYGVVPDCRYSEIDCVRPTRYVFVVYAQIQKRKENLSLYKEF